MPMHNPPHPAEGLKDDLEALNLTTAQAAKALGVSRQQLHRVLAQQSAISPEMALRLEAVIGVKADLWLRLQAAYDLAQARQNKPVWVDEDDAPDLSTPEWSQIFDSKPVRRGRPPLASPKQSTTVRLDPDILEYLRAGGPGWQTRLNAFLREAITAEQSQNARPEKATRT